VTSGVSVALIRQLKENNYSIIYISHHLSEVLTITDRIMVLRDGIKVDICILNAATALPGSRKTASGQDEMFVVNYLSNVILSQLLIRQSVVELKDSGEKLILRSKLHNELRNYKMVINCNILTILFITSLVFVFTLVKG